MANFCQSCGAPLTPDSKFCPGCGSPVMGPHQPAQPAQPAPVDNPQQVTQTVRQYPQPRPSAPQQSVQPPQPVYQQPQQQPAYQPAKPPKPSKQKKGKGGLIAVIIILAVALIGAVLFFGLRDGGFLRGGKSGEAAGGPADRTGTNTAAMLDYAKRLEEMGNPEAAAEIYARLREAGQADMNEAAGYYRDDPRRQMLDALSEEDLYNALAEKGSDNE